MGFFDKLFKRNMTKKKDYVWFTCPRCSQVFFKKSALLKHMGHTCCQPRINPYGKGKKYSPSQNKA